MSKNSNGEGSIYKRMRDGKLIRYEGQISYEDADGNRKRHTVYGRTRKDVADALKDARDRLDDGAPVKDATVTVGAWLKRWRATSLAASAVKPATKNTYPRSLLRAVQGAAKKAGIGGVGVHTLRHSAAVGWLEGGTHLRGVADMLGHSSVAVTGDVYLHSSDTVTRAAVDGWGEALGL